jgi:hypothetical protein
MRERFMAKVEVTEGCWLWRGCRNRAGYGRIGVGGQTKLAHRVSYELHVGPITPGMHVLHSCIAQRSCVNPAHLRVGTAKENTADKLAQGRCPNVAGERNPRAKLTSDAVARIRTEFAAGVASRSELGRRYGVSSVMVGLIVRGKNWRAA